MDEQLGQEVYIGLDTHRQTIHGTAMNKEGGIICSYRFLNLYLLSQQQLNILKFLWLYDNL